MRDLVSNEQCVVMGVLTLSGTTPALSSYIDVSGFNAATIEVIPLTVTDAGTAEGFTVTLQESADTTGAGAGTVAATQIVEGANTVTVTSDAADENIAGEFGYLGGKRYVGVSAVGTTGTDATVLIRATLGKPHKAPTTYIGTAVART